MERSRGSFPSALSIILVDHAVQIVSMLHRRFPAAFTPAIVSSLSSALAAPSKAALAALAPEQREKDDASRVTRQRPVLRVCSELALVGIIRDGQGRSGGEWIMKVLKELASKSTRFSSIICHICPCSYPMTQLCPLCHFFRRSSRHTLVHILASYRQLRRNKFLRFPNLGNYHLRKQPNLAQQAAISPH
jgi:hypothetical protein